MRLVNYLFIFDSIPNSVIANNEQWGGPACDPPPPQQQGFPTGGWVQRGRTGSTLCQDPLATTL
jgi:hypothetical protein